MSALATGFALTLAPRFHSPLAWSERLRINSGCEGPDCRVPRPDWRTLTTAELENLLAPSTSGQLSLLGIPEYLRRQWWDLASQEIVEGNTAGPGFQAFARALRAYFDFKAWPLPPDAACDVVLSEPGRPFHVPTVTPGVWGGINLGDESCTLDFVNLAPARCRQMLNVSAPIEPDWPTYFFRTFPDYPLVRLTLPSGEGFRLPDEGLLWTASTEGKSEPGVMLIVRGATAIPSVSL